ncbi:G-protein-signaling modulator 1-like [Polyodon spathula]|nr:G-protein-signaling modulator 1-like [Polyodon spathula]
MEEEGEGSEGESGGGAGVGAGGTAGEGAVSPDSAVPPSRTLHPRAAELQARRLTPDLPDSLFELLFQSQGRRLNDQRCSFRRGREGLQRGWQSEPSTPVEKRKVIFSSMTSLQTEEFFDMLANSQGRRLDTQRAELQEPPPPSSPSCENEATVEGAGSEEEPNLSVTENRGTVKKAADEELYSMILSYQVQGRIDEQRSRPPGPVDDEGFFSLLLRVQGGRMEEQRVELPEGLLRRVNSH